MVSGDRKEHLLVERLRDGDPTASADLFALFLTRLVEALVHMPALGAARDDPELLHDAAEDALFELAERPHSYDAERAPLFSYLRMAARANALNALSKRSRRNLHVTPVGGSVELDRARGNITQSVADADDELERQRIAAAIENVVPDPRDRRIVQMMIDGERNRLAYAEVLGVAELPVSERNREVDRAKDRLRKKLQRAGRGRLLGRSGKESEG